MLINYQEQVDSVPLVVLVLFLKNLLKINIWLRALANPQYGCRRIINRHHMIFIHQWRICAIMLYIKHKNLSVTELTF